MTTRADDELWSAIADPSRRRVLDLLVTNGDVSASWLAGHVPFSRQAVSKHLVIRDNVSDHDRDRGILFNATNYADISGNTVIGGPQPAERWATSDNRVAEEGVPQTEAGSSASVRGQRIGPEKCVFIYNTNRNRIERNWLYGYILCRLGARSRRLDDLEVLRRAD